MNAAGSALPNVPGAVIDISVDPAFLHDATERFVLLSSGLWLSLYDHATRPSDSFDLSHGFTIVAELPDADVVRHSRATSRYELVASLARVANMGEDDHLAVVLTEKIMQTMHAHEHSPAEVVEQIFELLASEWSIVDLDASARGGV